MKAQIRDRLGKVAYEAAIQKLGPAVSWEELSEQYRVFYGDIAEAVVQELGGMMVAQLQYIAMALTDRPIEITLGEKVAQWPKKESNS